MDSRDTASAARSCLFIIGIGAVLALIVCVVLALGWLGVLPEEEGRPADQRGDVTTSDPLLFSVIDVGQGACVVVITPDGHTLVADTGRSQERVSEVVVPWLREHGVEEIDYLVATNPDQDHIGGMSRMLEELPVRVWLDPVVPTTNQAYGRALELVDELGIEPQRARRGQQLDLGPEVTATVLWPQDPLIMDGDEPDHNENSVVIQITHGDVRFLITGDIEDDAEQALVELDTDGSLRSDVLVTAHHGSRTSSTAAFLDAVSPNVALIPVGLDNQYEHPHDEVIQRLRFRGVRIYRTDTDGTLEVRSDGERYEVTPLGTAAP